MKQQRNHTLSINIHMYIVIYSKVTTTIRCHGKTCIYITVLTI